ncbi:hypothetical protein KKF91_00800, partial [Myxococcota bacterium]|nr:hypothetical protein [Myxococcota bacterium]
KLHRGGRIGLGYTLEEGRRIFIVVTPYLGAEGGLFRLVITLLSPRPPPHKLSLDRGWRVS